MDNIWIIYGYTMDMVIIFLYTDGLMVVKNGG